MRITMLDRAINQGKADGHKYIGTVSGQASTRKGSNVRALLDRMGVDPADVIIYYGPKRQRASEGYKLAVFAR